MFHQEHCSHYQCRNMFLNMRVWSLITHLPVTAHGHDSILTIVDWLSKLVYCIPCKEAIIADEMAQLFLSVVVA